MTTAIIVQARMTSTRLPGKVLRTVLGKPLLEFQIERLRRVSGADGIVIATTINSSDDPIVSFCGRVGVAVFRGSEEDVLGRYFRAAEQVQAEHVVRVTSDCPLIDPAVVDDVIATYADGQRFDYVSNTVERTFPRGLDTEVFSAGVLSTIDQEATAPRQREHVTPFVLEHPERFRMGQVRNGRDLSRYRWTVDTPEDFELIRGILEQLYPVKPQFAMSDVLSFLEKHPDLAMINEHICQKELLP